MISGRGMVGASAGGKPRLPGSVCSWLDCIFMTMTPTDRGRHLDHHGIWRLGQATTRRQRHLSHASPAPGGESGPPSAEQRCKRILPL